MNANRRSLKIITLASIMLLCGLTALTRAGSAGGAKNVTTNLFIPLQEIVNDSVTGELVDFSGEVHMIAHAKTFADGSVIVSIQDNGFIPGIGENTGDRYHGKIHDTNRFSFKTTDLPFTVTIQCDLRVANAGSCNDLEVPLMVQFTVQKDGSVSAHYVEDDGGDIAP